MEEAVVAEPKLTRAQRRQKERDGKKLISCFVCGASMYPRVIENPKTQKEKEAIFCGACHSNLTEMLAAYKEFEANLKKQSEKADKQEEAAVASTEDQNPVEHQPSDPV